MGDRSGSSDRTLPPAIVVLADRLRALLGDRLVGVYLGGSASMGDFAPATSDWDILVVTDGWLDVIRLAAIADIHRTLLEELPEADRIEGDYAPLEVIAPQGTTVPVPGVHRGEFEPLSAEIMLSADNIANMRLHGIPVYGPSPREILPEVTAADVRRAVRAMILDRPAACGGETGAAEELLDLMRSLCALETGLPATKSEGAAWALLNLEARHHPAIRRALVARRGEPVPADDWLLRATLADLVSTARRVASRTDV